MRPRYEVQEFTICEGWVNTWSCENDDGDYEPTYFDTVNEAQLALNDFLTDMRYEYERGNIASPDDPENFKIVEVAI